MYCSKGSSSYFFVHLIWLPQLHLLDIELDSLSCSKSMYTKVILNKSRERCLYYKYPQWDRWRPNWWVFPDFLPILLRLFSDFRVVEITYVYEVNITAMLMDTIKLPLKGRNHNSWDMKKEVVHLAAHTELQSVECCWHSHRCRMSTQADGILFWHLGETEQQVTNGHKAVISCDPYEEVLSGDKERKQHSWANQPPQEMSCLSAKKLPKQWQWQKGGRGPKWRGSWGSNTWLFGNRWVFMWMVTVMAFFPKTVVTYHSRNERQICSSSWFWIPSVWTQSPCNSFPWQVPDEERNRIKLSSCWSYFCFLPQMSGKNSQVFIHVSVCI